jgi:hypothetical protein
MADEPQIKAWKFIEPPFIPLCLFLAEFTIMPLCYGGWTIGANISIVGVTVVLFVAWAIISTFAHRDSTGTSVGENAVLVLKAMKR